MGMTNFLDFPSNCAKYGGLLVYGCAYCFFLLTIALPLLVMGQGLGQKFQNSNVWAKLHPKLAGLGYANAYNVFQIMTTYSIIMSWMLNFAIHSFSLPWGSEASQASTSNTSSVVRVVLSPLTATVFIVLLPGDISV